MSFWNHVLEKDEGKQKMLRWNLGGSFMYKLTLLVIQLFVFYLFQTAAIFWSQSLSLSKPFLSNIHFGILHYIL